MTREQLLPLVEQYRAGLDAELMLLHRLQALAVVRAELVQADQSVQSSPVVWVPAQHYARAVDLMTRIAETGPSPCDICPEESEGRFDVCWTCQE